MDTGLFSLINGTLTSSVLDLFMPFITEKSNFIGVILIAVLFITVKGSRRDKVGLLILAVAVIAGDLISNLLKDVFMRVRPCTDIADARLLVGCGGSYSMPSGHATNIFTAMVFLSTRYRRFYPAFLTMAVLVAYSRVYVGVHYPLDVIVGAALGTGVAFVFAEADRRLISPRFVSNEKGGAVEVQE